MTQSNIADISEIKKHIQLFPEQLIHKLRSHYCAQKVQVCKHLHELVCAPLHEHACTPYLEHVCKHYVLSLLVLMDSSHCVV